MKQKLVMSQILVTATIGALTYFGVPAWRASPEGRACRANPPLAQRSQKEPGKAKPEPIQPIQGETGRAKRGESVSPSDLESMTEKAMSRWHVPGCAVVVVHRRKVVLLKGFGVRRQDKPARITKETLFPIGSISKGFTSAVVARLIEEKKIRWDTKISRFVNVRFQKSLLTDNVTFQDLLCHRVGLDSSNRWWFSSNATRAELIANLHKIPIRREFRSEFLYCNIGVMVAGEAAASAAGSSWPNVLNERILVPLGMKKTLADVKDPANLDNWASGHHLNDQGRLTVHKFNQVSNCGPAVGIWSNAVDMSKWIRLHLSVDQPMRHVLTEESIIELHAPQMVVKTGNRFWKKFPNKNHLSAAFGWFALDYRGRSTLQHSGNINGVRSHIAIMPTEQMGIVVLANRAGSALPMSLAYDVFDAFLGPGGPNAKSRNVLLQREQDKADRDLTYSRLIDAVRRKLATNDPASAVELCTQAAKVCPERESAFVNRGLALIKLNRNPEAMKDLRRAVAIDPRCAPAWDAMGWIHVGNRNYRAAITQFNKAINANSASARFLSNRANAKLKLGDHAGAIEDASQALQLNNKLASAYLIRGLAYLHIGEKEKAGLDLLKAKELKGRE